MILPDFLIGGAPKAGTTALYNYLRQHPEICMSEPKETFFFTDEYRRGAEWLAQHFGHCSGEKTVGEASTTTLYDPEAPKRIQDVLGAPKFIFVLRDPVERAYSEYLFFVHKGRIPSNISFADVVFRKESEHAERILEMGCYERFLGRFEEAFGWDKMKIVIHRNFRSAPERILKEVFEFLGVDETVRPNALGDHNVTRAPTSPMVYYWVRRLWHTVRDTVEAKFPDATETARKAVRRVLFSEEKPPMGEEVRAYLTEFYEEPTSRLEDSLGRELSRWKK
jgi:hypothetical protein